jgi:nitrite reductase/ring-hydroxylating ferredoxin subunit
MLVKLCDKNILVIGEPKSFKVKGCEVFAVNGGDKIFCLDARCTHAGAPLAEGTLIGEVFTCPWHYSQFNINNGMVLRGPAQKPLKTYHVEEKGNSVFIDL